MTEFAQALQGKTYQELPADLKPKFENYQFPLQIVKIYKQNGKWSWSIDFQKKPIYEVYKLYKANLIDLPFYQRDKSWSIEKKSELLFTILTGLPIPPILMYEFYDGNSIRYQILDGWQRLSTVMDFLDNKFKIKLDLNIDHFDPDNTTKEEILKALFERLNYRSTPLSKARIILLTALSLNNPNSKEKILLILKYYKNNRLENSTETALNFLIRSLTSFYFTKLKNHAEEKLEKILKGKKHKSFSLIQTTLFKDLISEIPIEEFRKVFEILIDLITLTTNDNIALIKRTNFLGLSEIIGIAIYLIKDSYFPSNRKKIKEIIRELQSKERAYLKKINKETITRNAKVYLQTMEFLIKEVKQITPVTEK